MDEPRGINSEAASPPGASCGETARVRWVVATMLVLWLTVILSRNVIRSHWWTYRLETAAVPQERFAYFHRLCSLGDRAVPAVSRLLASPDNGLRSFAVGVLHHAEGNTAFELLAAACRDQDDDVARLAMQGLAMRADGRNVTVLADVAVEDGVRRGMMSAAALADIGSTAAIEVLIDLLETSPSPGIRVQAIEGLKNLRAESAMESLVAALGDSGVYEGVTEGSLRAQRAFDEAEADVAEDWRQGVGTELRLSGRHVVWKCADGALRSITGCSPDGSGEGAFGVRGAVEAWQAWCSERRGVSTGLEP